MEGDRSSDRSRGVVARAAPLMLGLAGSAASPSAVADWDLRVGGVVDVGIERAGGAVDWNGVAPGKAGYRESGQRTSRLSIRADERVGVAGRAGVLVEFGFRAGTGRGGDADPGRDLPAAGGLQERAAYVQLSHYAQGRFRVGRLPAPLQEVVDLGHGWGSETVAGDGLAGLLGRGCPGSGAEGRGDPRCFAVATRAGLRYDAPALGSWQLSLQHDPQSHEPAGAAPPRSSVVLAYRHGATAVSGGVTRTEGQASAIALGWRQSLGPVTLQFQVTVGRGDASERRHAFAGAAVPLQGGELRFGVSQWRDTAAAGQHARQALGWHRPLSMRTTLHADVARIRLADGRRGRGAEAGLRVVF